MRAWRLGDADWALEANAALDPRRTVFLGGVPRPLRARMPHSLFSPAALLKHTTTSVRYSYEYVTYMAPDIRLQSDMARSSRHAVPNAPNARGRRGRRSPSPPLPHPPPPPFPVPCGLSPLTRVRVCRHSCARLHRICIALPSRIDSIPKLILSLRVLDEYTPYEYVQYTRTVKPISENVR